MLPTPRNNLTIPPSASSNDAVYTQGVLGMNKYGSAAAIKRAAPTAEPCIPSLTCLRARLNSRSRSGSETITPPLSACVTTPRFIPHALQNLVPSFECVEQVGQYILSALPRVARRGFNR